jgi:hypothetical protein
MSRTLMRLRCPSAREIGPAVLAGYRFIVTSDGYASVVPARGGLVHGLLWRLAPRDLAALNAYECLDRGLYRAVMRPVRPAGTRARSCAALVYVGRSRTAGTPRPGYLDVVLAAARDLDFPPAYLEALARWGAGHRRGALAHDGGRAA